MAKKKDYYAELRKLQTDVCNEIQKETKRIGKDFTTQNVEDIEFFGYDSCIDQSIIKLTKEGDIVQHLGKQGEGEPFSVHSAIAEDIISVVDAISILNDLRKI